MKIAIVGSRKFNDYDTICKFIEQRFDLDQIDAVVSGGAKGVDALAERYARDHHLELIVKSANWAKYGRVAGPIRNKLIVEEADAIIAFPAAESIGTYNTISLAQKLGKKLEVCNV